MSFPVRILKQWRVHHIHISLCQLGEMRRTIKSPVTDKGNTEVDRIHVQAHICTDTCATSTVAKLDSYKCSVVKQGPANWSVIPSGCKNYRLLLSYFRQSITAQKSTKKDVEQATYNAHDQGTCKRLSQQMKQTQECFAQALRTTAFSWKNKSQLWKLRSRCQKELERNLNQRKIRVFFNKLSLYYF